MPLLTHIIAVLARNRFLLIPVFLLLAFGSWGRTRRRKWLIRAIIITIGVGELIGGPLLSDWLIYNIGQTAPARITSTYATSTEINDHDVIGYNVLISPSPGKLIETRFEDDESNVFPLADFSDPQPDISFNVRYLPAFPRDFVILTDDDSPWTRQQHCNALSLHLTSAQQKFNFAQGAPPYRQPYVAAIDAYLQQDCAGEAEGAESFRNDRTRAEAGVVDGVE